MYIESEEQWEVMVDETAQQAVGSAPKTDSGLRDMSISI